MHVHICVCVCVLFASMCIRIRKPDNVEIVPQETPTFSLSVKVGWTKWPLNPMICFSLFSFGIPRACHNAHSVSFPDFKAWIGTGH